MKAIILVAGYATRLYPLTLNTPKALLPLDGKPIIDYIVEQINEIPEINEIIVVSNDKFYNDFKNWAEGSNIKVLNDKSTNEENRLGAIGDINFAIEQCNINEDVMIIAGDNYFTYKLSDYYNFYKKNNKDYICTKTIDDEDDIKRYAVVVLDENNKVIDLEEKPQNPKSNTAAFATYIYKKETLPLFREYLDQGMNKDAPGFFVQWLHKVKDVYAYTMHGDCFDIGTKESYEDVQKIVKELNKLQ